MTTLAADPAVRALVNQIARRHCGPTVDLDELIGAGMLAACEAAERFNPAKGSLTGFLRRRIEGAVVDAAQRDRSPIRTPRGCQPIRTVGDSQREGQGDGLVTLADLVVDYRADQLPDVTKMVDALPGIEAKVIRCLWGLDDMPQMEVNDLADVLGLTTAEVATIHDDAIETLRRRFDDHDYHILNIEEPTMSRLNGYHAPESTVDTMTEPSSSHCCPSCDTPFKNPASKRCYNRQCSRSGYLGRSTTAKPEKTRATRRPVAACPSAAADTTVVTPGPAQSLADEIQIMSLMAGLVPAARQRVLSWARSAFGV